MAYCHEYATKEWHARFSRMLIGKFTDEDFTISPALMKQHMCQTYNFAAENFEVRFYHPPGSRKNYYVFYFSNHNLWLQMMRQLPRPTQIQEEPFWIKDFWWGRDIFGMDWTTPPQH